MNNPFRIQDNAISDRNLIATKKARWVEGISPHPGNDIDVLKPALKSRRLSAAMLAVFSMLFLFFARSAQLQIVNGEEYREAAETNRLRNVRVPAPRGAIVDRNGIELTRNVPRFELLRRSLNFSSKEIVQSNLTLEEVYPMMISGDDNTNLELATISAREYPYGPSFAHLLGYLGKIEEPEKDKYLAQGLSLSSLVGKAGLEAVFEDYLRGQDGRKYIEVDASEGVQNILALEEARAGQILKLTIDSRLQQKSFDILKDALKSVPTKRGAVVVLDPYNGGILALVSLPSYDNNLFSNRTNSPETLREIFINPDQPLFNRAISGTYPSGSTIKLAVAAAALQEKIINRSTTILSTGGLRVAQWFFPDWKPGGHGLVNVTSAIAQSVNSFFYTITGGWGGREGLGIERTVEYLQNFGFGKPTGIELPAEASGLVPTPQWKRSQKGEQWYIGDTYHLAIGQGDFLVTPLQIARMTAYFANGGKWIKPHLVLDQEKSDMEQNENNPGIKAEHVQAVRQGMRDAVLYGSARSLQALTPASAGKTGTAQWSSLKPPHAWFTGWIIYDHPEIVVTVLIEEGGEGSIAAIPVAREIMNFWLSTPDRG